MMDFDDFFWAYLPRIVGIYLGALLICIVIKFITC